MPPSSPWRPLRGDMTPSPTLRGRGGWLPSGRRVGMGVWMRELQSPPPATREPPPCEGVGLCLLGAPIEGSCRAAFARLRGSFNPIPPYGVLSHAGRVPRSVSICPYIWANAKKILRQRLSTFGRMQNFPSQGKQESDVVISSGGVAEVEKSHNEVEMPRQARHDRRGKDAST